MREAEIREDWQIVAKDHVGSRIVYFFDSIRFPDVVKIQVSVSRTFADPEKRAWELLSDIVK